MSRDRKSRRFVKERELFLKSIMLGLKPAQASSKDPSRDPFHMKPFLSLSNTWFPNQISPLSITTLFFPWRCAKWLKFEPGIYDVTIWSRHDCAKQLIFIGPSSATHYKWPRTNIKQSLFVTSIVPKPRYVGDFRWLSHPPIESNKNSSVNRTRSDSTCTDHIILQNRNSSKIIRPWMFKLEEISIPEDLLIYLIKKTTLAILDNVD